MNTYYITFSKNHPLSGFHIVVRAVDSQDVRVLALEIFSEESFMVSTSKPDSMQFGPIEEIL
jgi:hypothetical protein